MDRSIITLEAVQAEHFVERQRNEAFQAELDKVKAERVKKDEATLEAWGEVEELKSELVRSRGEKDDAVSDAKRETEELQLAIKRVRGEKGKAIAESEGIIRRLESRLTEANNAIESLRSSMETMEQSSDKSVFHLRQQLDPCATRGGACKRGDGKYEGQTGRGGVCASGVEGGWGEIGKGFDGEGEENY